VPRRIALRKEWTLGERIGDRSAFGQVYEAVADDGTIGVIKLIPKKPGAKRETLFEDLAGVPNVVPIIDSGETRTSWVIAMPRAERSLRAELQSAGGPLPVDEAVPILIHVAKALAALDGRVVHRDLKPDNVLLIGDSWSLADFGIARYAEASTATETWKATFSMAYAAPERWNYEHATGATDVYSFGIMAHELITGSKPFPGPNADDFRDQHLHADPPEITGVPAQLASLVSECMLKAPGSRPTATQILGRLQRVLTPTSPGAGSLQAASQAMAEVSARKQAQESAATSEAQRRSALFDGARRSLEAISAQLRQAIDDNASAASQVRRSEFKEWAVSLGVATIGMDPPTLSDPGSWGAWKPQFDVIAFAEIGLLIPEDQWGYRGRGHSLYYCDAQDEGVYRWYETAFMVMPMIPRRTTLDPIPFPPGENAGKALSRSIAEWQVAWPFTAIDQGDQAEFIDRWLGWFGQAAAGQLRHPSSMPERPPGGSFRN
jgi:hypothetical protein